MPATAYIILSLCLGIGIICVASGIMEYYMAKAQEIRFNIQMKQ